MAQLRDLTVTGYTALGQATGVTQAGSDSSNALATTEFVKQAFVNNDALRYKGTIVPIWDNENGGTLTPAGSPGETYRVTRTGVINGTTVTQGALLICRIATEAATQDAFAAAPSSFSDSIPYYFRYSRQSTATRIGGWVSGYYYEQILDNGHPYFYVETSSLSSLTTSTVDSSCFFYEQNSGSGVTQVFVTYNSTYFKEPDTVANKSDYTPIYASLNSTNYSSVRTAMSNNIYTTGTADSTSTHFDIVNLNWDYITSDSEGLLYKLEGAFSDGYALIAYGTQGIVASSQYKLDEACRRGVADSRYRQDSANLVAYEIFNEADQEIERNSESIEYLSQIISEEKEIDTASVSYDFQDASAGLNLEDSLAEYEYVGYLLQIATGSASGTSLSGKNFYTLSNSTYTLATTWNANTIYYQPKYWIPDTNNAGSYIPILTGTAQENVTYYRRVVTQHDQTQYPNLHLSSINTVEDQLVALHRMINGGQNAAEAVATGVVNQNIYNYDGATGTRFVLNDVNNLLTKVGSGIVDTSLLPSGQASDLTSVANLVNGILGTNSYTGNVVTTINNNQGLLNIAMNYLGKAPILDWFTNDNIAGTLKTISPTGSANSYGIYLAPGGFNILDTNGLLTNPLFTVTNTKAETIVPIQLKSTAVASNGVTWKMFIRSNGNLSFGLV